MILKTERLILRPWEETDAEECYQYAKDPRVGPIAGWPVHTSIENSRQVIRNVLMVPETYAIVLKETSLPIGSIGLHRNNLAEKEDEAELGYWLGVPYWGQGLVSEASKELLRHAFEDLRLARIWCGCYDGNEKSKRVLEKLGFRFQWTAEDAPVPQMGETRKEHVSLLTKDQWIWDKIIRVENNKKKYLPLLLLADEQENMIDRYLERGTLYVVEDNGVAKAETVVTDQGDGIVEIKSLAVDPQYQGKEYGRSLIRFVADRYKGRYTVLQVGTGDSPITVPFYESCGFAQHHVDRGFFLDNYDHPIFEAGKQLRDMVYLRMPLGKLHQEAEICHRNENL